IQMRLRAVATLFHHTRSDRISLSVCSICSDELRRLGANRAYCVAEGVVLPMMFLCRSRSITWRGVIPDTAKQTMPADRSCDIGVCNVICGIFARPCFNC